ncbi:hypothetical protein BDR06DRAFT_967986 [Suillus hirtellus]|nr:hypothetical protein BDR06DRAFT_967986 [Suillus hirtellus]
MYRGAGIQMGTGDMDRTSEDIFSYSEDDLSDDAWKRRTEADAGKSANMIVGHQWRSMNYVAYLCWLTLKSMKDSATSNAGGPEEQLENEAAPESKPYLSKICQLREEDLMKEDAKYLKELNSLVRSLDQQNQHAGKEVLEVHEELQIDETQDLYLQVAENSVRSFDQLA